MLPTRLASRLSLPVVAAAMAGASGRGLVVAACRAGVIGSFPTHNARTVGELDRWLHRIHGELQASDTATPIALVEPNLVVRRTNARLSADVDCLVQHGVEVAITSVGSPALAVGPLHDVGRLVFADVATMRHVDTRSRPAWTGSCCCRREPAGKQGQRTRLHSSGPYANSMTGRLYSQAACPKAPRSSPPRFSGLISVTWARSSSRHPKASPMAHTARRSCKHDSTTWSRHPCQAVCPRTSSDHGGSHSRSPTQAPPPPASSPTTARLSTSSVGCWT